MNTKDKDVPVAWAYLIDRGKDTLSLECQLGEHFQEHDYMGVIGEPIPLYTHTKRKPLTDAEIEELCWTEMDRRLLSFARAIERAHGIGDEV